MGDYSFSFLVDIHHRRNDHLRPCLSYHLSCLLSFPFEVGHLSFTCNRCNVAGYSLYLRSLLRRSDFEGDLGIHRVHNVDHVVPH